MGAAVNIVNQLKEINMDKLQEHLDYERGGYDRFEGFDRGDTRSYEEELEAKNEAWARENGY